MSHGILRLSWSMHITKYDPFNEKATLFHQANEGTVIICRHKPMLVLLDASLL